MAEEMKQISGKSMGQLVNAVQEKGLNEGFGAMEELREIGMPAVAPLVELLISGNQNIRWRSAMALARVGEYSVEPLIEAAGTRDVSIKNPAIWALAEIKSPNAVQPLINIMQEEESECCRILTAAALLKIDDPEGIAAVNREFERSGEEFRGRVDEAFSGS